MAVRTKAQLPIPQATLADLQTELPTQYGACVWDGQGDKTLVIRVPGDEPDMIHDMENAVETIAPAHVMEARHCVLVGSRKIQAVPMEPMRQLMSRRVHMDQDQVAALRTILPGTLATHLYKSPDDPKRRLRLGVGMPIEQVGDAEDSDFDELAKLLGPAIKERKLEGLHCVYLVAAKDHVRLQPGPFVDDILQKWQDEERLMEIARERAAREERDRAKRIEDRDRLMAAIEKHKETRVVRAPMANALLESKSEITAVPRERRSPAPDLERSARIDRLGAAETEPVSSNYMARTNSRYESLHSTVDAITGRSPQPAQSAPREIAYDYDEPEPMPRRTDTRSMLERNGYQVLESPDVAGFELSAAAERDGAYPQRLIVLETNRFTRNDAEDLLSAARTLGPDMALAIGDQIDNEARGLILASKVKWVRRSELSKITL